MMFMGLAMFFRPLSVLGDVIPFVGSLIGMGTTIVAFLLAAALSLVTIAVAWIYYRPLLGIGLLVLAVAFTYGIRALSKSAKAKQIPATA